MSQPHPFAAAPATKGRVRAVPKPAVTVYGYALPAARALTRKPGSFALPARARFSGKWQAAWRLTGRSFAGTGG